jgi:hypothetical protein
MIGHSQIGQFEIEPWIGQPTFLGNFDSTLVIVSNLHNVDNLPSLEQKFVKKN